MDVRPLFYPLLLCSALAFGHYQEGPRVWVSECGGGSLPVSFLRGRRMLPDRVAWWLGFLWTSLSIFSCSKDPLALIYPPQSF